VARLRATVFVAFGATRELLRLTAFMPASAFSSSLSGLLV
jgi:hypothetical protein